MARGWLEGRTHPVTGRPLEMEHLALPAGSVVCCLSHAAHGVAPKAVGRESRLCSLFCYRKPWADGRAQPPWEVPPVWARPRPGAGSFPRYWRSCSAPATTAS